MSKKKRRKKREYVRISCLSPVPNIGNPRFVKSTDSTLGSVRRTWKRKTFVVVRMANSNFYNVKWWNSPDPPCWSDTPFCTGGTCHWDVLINNVVRKNVGYKLPLVGYNLLFRRKNVGYKILLRRQNVGCAQLTLQWDQPSQHPWPQMTSCRWLMCPLPGEQLQRLKGDKFRMK